MDDADPLVVTFLCVCLPTIGEPGRCYAILGGGLVVHGRSRLEVSGPHRTSRGGRASTRTVGGVAGPRGKSHAGSLSASLERMLLSASDPAPGSPLARDPFQMATHGMRTFNRIAHQADHRWCLLIDELEIAPVEIVEHVMRVVRGGGSELILKASMSPSDHKRGGTLLTDIGRPMPGHDFVPVHLLSQSPAARRHFAQVLWHRTLDEAGIDPVSIEASFGRSFQAAAHEEGVIDPIRAEFELALTWDKDLSAWFSERNLTLEKLESMEYVDCSAIARSTYPLLVFRNGIYKTKDHPKGWGRRSRKKEFEAFSGASQIITALEANPRWIKSAFRIMVGNVSRVNGQVDAPMQFSALLDVARSFESFLRFVPTPDVTGRVVNDMSLIQFVDAIAKTMHAFHTGKFSPDPPNSFVIDDSMARRFGPIIDLGLYSGVLCMCEADRRPQFCPSMQANDFD